MGHHLDETGEFKSDKYDWCPVGYFALSFDDPLALQAIRRYAAITEDKELSKDLLRAVIKAENGMKELDA